MEELSFVRRDERALIVATDSGEEFRLLVDDAMLSELRHLNRRESASGKARPREIQALIRAGKSRAEVAEITGLDEVDVERYEEPVLAERRYILERAQAVPVRAGEGQGEQQQFGAVIAERLLGLSAADENWSSWRDEEAGWMVALEFVSHDVSHRAVWSFDHRKSTLSPVTPDAIILSKQGDVGDRLIPKLRAVDTADRQAAGFAPEAFEGSDEPPADAPAEAGAQRRDDDDRSAEWARRQEIEQRAFSHTDEISDLGQTADLLDALRRRRGERERGGAAAAFPAAEAATTAQHPSAGGPGASESSDASSTSGTSDSADPAPEREAEPEDGALIPPLETSDETAAPDPSPRGAADADRRSRKGKGRASIPSWDDILFGTRSDEDPS